jgi:hypothetical protein
MNRFKFTGSIASERNYEANTEEQGWIIELRAGKISLTKEESQRSKDELWPEAENMARLFLEDLRWEYGEPLSANITSCAVMGEQLLRLNDASPKMKDKIEEVVYHRVTATAGSNFEALGPGPVYHPWSRHETALKARKYFLLAQDKPEESLWYLYKAIELLKQYYLGWKVMAGRLGVSQGYVDYVKRLADDTKYDQRHAPKPGESAAELTTAERKECTVRVKDLIDKFAKLNPA